MSKVNKLEGLNKEQLAIDEWIDVMIKRDMTIDDWLTESYIVDRDADTFPNAKLAKEIKATKLWKVLG